MDENKMLETVGEGAKVVSKFEEITQMLLGPIITTRQSNAAIKAARKQIDFIRENPDMEIAFSENGSVSTRERTPQELFARGIIRETGDMIYQQNNLESITEKAQSMISEAEDPKETIDVDWLMRFKDAAKNISAEEMQLIWAKILAGEYEKPGSISLRTLDVVRNLSTEEAKMFTKTTSLVFNSSNGCFILSDSSLLKKKGLSHSSILTLDECGLLEYGGGNLNLNYSIQKRESLLFSYAKRTIRLYNPNELPAKGMISVYRLTAAGRDLYSIVENTSSGEIAFSIAASIKNSYYSDWDIVNESYSGDECKVPSIKVSIIAEAPGGTSTTTLVD